MSFVILPLRTALLLILQVISREGGHSGAQE